MATPNRCVREKIPERFVWTDMLLVGFPVALTRSIIALETGDSVYSQPDDKNSYRY